MAHHISTDIQEKMEVLHVSAQGLADVLRNTREKVKEVRDLLKYPQQYEGYFAQFIGTLRDLNQLAEQYQTRILGPIEQSPEKDHRREEAIERCQRKIEDLEKELLLEKKAKDEALTRVSSLASQLLRPGNPDISDISDRNRPTRLAEDFKNLYDDEWTDAFEFLTEERKLKEWEATTVLYDLLKVCNGVSKDALQTQYKQLTECVTSPNILNRSTSKSGAYNSDPLSGNHPSSSSVPKQQPSGSVQNFSKTVGAGPGQTVRQTVMGSMPGQNFRQSVFGKDAMNGKNDLDHLESQMKEFRKAISVDILNTITKQELITAVKKHFGSQQDILSNDHIITYIMKCFKVCWLMGVQYPPMEIDFSHGKGEPLNLDLFKEYKNRGSRISLIIWPPIYLHHNGPLAGKGYAEGDGSK